MTGKKLEARGNAVIAVYPDSQYPDPPVAFCDTADRAAFIARACNSYYDMLAALEDIVSGMPAACPFDDEEWAEFVAVQRAAIAKAKGIK